jgi:uncharacterized protein (TIGR02001 family)
MKFFTQSLIAGAVLAATASSAMADVSANVGVMSDYFYRGIVQNTTATTNGGVDFENGGFYAGTWAADVEDGLEIDLYGGYGIETESGLGLSVGFTGYYYTGDFDDTYEEINLGASFGILSLEYSFGTYGNFDGPEMDYDFTAVTLEKNGFYGKYGSFGDEFDGSYLELGYGTEIGGFDAGVSLVINDEDLDLETGEGTETIIFSLSKSFDL